MSLSLLYMRVWISLAVLVLCLVAVGSVHAQKSARVTRSQYQYVMPKVRGSKARIVCPAFDNSKYPFHGIGFKIGDPFALTYKVYPNKKFSVAADVGKVASGLYNRYFRERFDFYIMSDTLPAESGLVYLSHRVEADLVAELKFLYHLDGTKISDGLQGYAGIGWEWRRSQLQYDYQYFPAGNNAQEPFASFGRTTATMGPQVVLGIEYSYFRIPVSAFMEVEYFTDVRADPGWQRFEGGVGLRYIF